MDTRLRFDEKEKMRFLARIQNAYKRASQFETVMPCLNRIINNGTEDLTEYILFSLKGIMEYLGIRTEILRSSEMNKDNSLTAQDRILEICKCLGTDVYINPSGGRALYQAKAFSKQGMELFFLDTKFQQVRYRQFQDEFVENLSIIDVLMFNTQDQVRGFLKEYDLNG